MLWALLCVLQLSPADSLRVASLARLPGLDKTFESTELGSPQVRLRTRQGTALVWLFRSRDTVFVAASIPDSTPNWSDDFVLSLDTRGDGAPSPQHDDFQWDFRRVLDSSVVTRGRNGRWEPPRDDPDWRLGADRAGGGWEVASRDWRNGWSLLLRLDPAWFTGQDGLLPRVAFRIHDAAPGGWYAWPLPRPGLPATMVEGAPGLWVPLR